MKRALLLGLLLSGCAQQDAGSPPLIRYGADTCEACRMIISEARFAAGLREADGTAHVFDDIGCLLRFLSEHEAAGVWVHDARTEAWIPAEKAHVLNSRTLVTPMGFGLAAAGSREAAQAMQRESGGTVLTWPEARTLNLQEPARR